MGAIKKKVTKKSMTPGEDLYFEQDRFEELVAQAKRNGRNMSNSEIYDEIRNQVWKESDERALTKAMALVEAAKEVLVSDCTGGAPGGGAGGGGGGGGSS